MERFFLKPAAKTGLRVEKKVPAMSLKSRQVEAPDLAIIPDEKLDDFSIGGGARQSQKVPRQAGILPTSRTFQLELQKIPVAPAITIRAESGTEAQKKMRTIQDGSRQEVQGKYWEMSLAPGRWNMLVPQLRKAVVSRHEEIVSGYACLGVIGWSLAGHFQGILVPETLHLRLLLPPGLQGTMMQGSLIQLPISPWECRGAFGSIIAASLPVIEGLVTDGTPAV